MRMSVGKSIFAKMMVLLCTVPMLVCAMALAGCSSANEDAAQQAMDLPTVRIGTMPTEDILPIWVALQTGLFEENGIDVEVATFDSAQSLSAAITSGDVDMAMTDIMRAVKLCESGADVDIEWITLGLTPEQGRFGVMAAAEAPYSTLTEMAAYVADKDDSERYAVGVAANTVPEYVFDMLCEQEGIAPGAIPTVEVASLPERYSLMATGNLGAAALPASLLAMGDSAGMKLLADDTQGGNISQSVMVARTEFAAADADAVMAVAQAWDGAVELINGDKESYRALLVEKSSINAGVADTYPISDYPLAIAGDALAHPAANIVEAQIAWMRDHGYGGQGIIYDPATGVISKNE